LVFDLPVTDIDGVDVDVKADVNNSWSVPN
jgi:hypothetical protein